VLNVKNHVRDDRVERVAEWHMRTLIDLGLRLEADDIIVTRGVMAGANATVRVDHEKIVTFRKGAANE
jgi:hypothetical protein